MRFPSNPHGDVHGQHKKESTGSEEFRGKHADAGEGTRTPTVSRQNLNLVRLPIPPHPQNEKVYPRNLPLPVAVDGPTVCRCTARARRTGCKRHQEAQNLCGDSRQRDAMVLYSAHCRIVKEFSGQTEIARRNPRLARQLNGKKRTAVKGAHCPPHDRYRTTPRASDAHRSPCSNPSGVPHSSCR